MSVDKSAAYFVGRPVAELVAPYAATDSAFGAKRLDGETVENASFKHCTFANISFKEVTLQSSTFLDCVFIGCYFRRSELVDSAFVGCRFIDCNFAHVSIKSSRFHHSSFRSCQLPYAELLHSLPSEPNLREDLTRNLALQSSQLGLASEARLYRMEEIRAREAHLRSAIVGQSQWYKEHFDGLARVRATLQLTLSLLNRWLWGYGERAWVLVRNLLFLTFFVFPAAFYVFRDGLAKSSESVIGAWDVLYLSLENVIPAGIDSGVAAVALTPRLLAGAESLFGVVAIALFAAYIFRWSLHR